VELLIDRVIVNDAQVEIRYVVPTGPKGETTPFCHLRLDYLYLLPSLEHHILSLLRWEPLHRTSYVCLRVGRVSV
jgi:hypothetical protein